MNDTSTNGKIFEMDKKTDEDPSKSTLLASLMEFPCPKAIEFSCTRTFESLRFAKNHATWHTKELKIPCPHAAERNCKHMFPKKCIADSLALASWCPLKQKMKKTKTKTEHTKTAKTKFCPACRG